MAWTKQDTYSYLYKIKEVTCRGVASYTPIFLNYILWEKETENKKYK